MEIKSGAWIKRHYEWYYITIDIRQSGAGVGYRIFDTFRTGL